MTTMMTRIKCLVGKHEPVKWSNEECAAMNVFDGIFAPWKCKHCDEVGGEFPIPDMPISEISRKGQ